MNKTKNTREIQLKLYWKHIAPGVDTLAYCLLRNYSHLVIWVKSEDKIQETLRVSSSSGVQLKQDTSVKRNQDQPEKLPVLIRGLGS